jgi:WYL domain
VADEAPVRRRDGVELAQLWESLRWQVEDRPAPVPVVARVRRDWLDMFCRICAAHLDGPVAGASMITKGSTPETGAKGFTITDGGDGEWVMVRLRFAAVPAARTLLSFGGNVEVVSPPEVRADLASVAADVVARYGPDPAGRVV